MRATVIYLALHCWLSGSAVLASGLCWVGYSDIHYGGTPWSWESGTNALNTISNHVRYAQTNFNPQFFIIPGDIGEVTASGATCITNYYHFFTNDMAVATSPYYAIPGNHDIVNGGNAACWTNRWPLHQSWTNGNYVFISLNIPLGAGAEFAISDSELDYLESVITNARPAFSNFVVTAHPSVVYNAAFGSVTSGKGLERLTNIFNMYSVVLYVHGHQHSVDASTNHIANTPTKQVMVPSLTRYLPDRGAYQVFTITNTTLQHFRYRTDTHALVSTDSFSVPQFISVWPAEPPLRIVFAGSVRANGGLQINP